MIPMAINNNRYIVGSDSAFSDAVKAIEEARAGQNLWSEVIDFSGDYGTSQAITKRSNILSGVASSFLSIVNRDLWIDLGDGIYHRIWAIHDDEKIELYDYVDSVPGTINISLWQPKRISVVLEGGEYHNALQMIDKPMCLTICSNEHAYWDNSTNDKTTDLEPTTFSMGKDFSGPVDMLFGDYSFDGLTIGNRSDQESAFYDGSVFAKGYDITVNTDPVGRCNFYFFDTRIESTFHADAVSLWHAGEQISMDSIFVGTEQAVEHISTDKAIMIGCMSTVSKELEGHYGNGALFANRYEGIVNTYKHDAVVMASLLKSERNKNAVPFQGLNKMGNIALLLASSESQNADPDTRLVSVGNLHIVDIPDGSSFGQGLRVANYLSSGSNGMLLSSYFDSFINFGDSTNYRDALADRGLIDLYYPYTIPSTENLNSGIVTQVKP